MLGWFSRRIFLGPAQCRLLSRGTAVFTHHRIGDSPRGCQDPFLYVSTHEFERQLSSLRERGFASTSLDDLAASIEEKRDRNGCRAVITFDDGFSSVLEHGLALLARQRFRAIQFLVAGRLGQRNDWDIAKGDVPEPLMDDRQIRDWLAAGHEIGSHSLTHRNLRHLNPTEAREEISGSKKLLEDRFGTAVRHFCYPYGSWNAAVRDLAIEAGYRTASTLVFGVNTQATALHELRRIPPLSSGEFVRKVVHRLGRAVRRKAGISTIKPASSGTSEPTAR